MATNLSIFQAAPVHSDSVSTHWVITQDCNNAKTTQDQNKTEFQLFKTENVQSYKNHPLYGQAWYNYKQ